MDVVSKRKRSEIMRAIKSKDSKMELSLRKLLNSCGFRYRKNVSRLPGKPDIAFIGKKVVVFLDSCFWHGCKRHCRLPSSNRKYWVAKIKKNKERDRSVNKRYKSLGWRVLRFWEHDLNKDISKITDKILRLVD